MRKRYSEKKKRQIVKEFQEGATIAELRKRYKIGNSTLYAWHKKYMEQASKVTNNGRDNAERIKQLEHENIRLRVAVVDLLLKCQTLESLRR